MSENNFNLVSDQSNFLIESNHYINYSDSITPQSISSNAVGSSVYDSIIGETGSVSLNHEQKTINFTQEYENPVVFATSVSYKGSDPAMVRITDITGSDFTAFIEEPNYLDPGTHLYEDVSYVVMEAGNYELENGALIEVGMINTNATVKQKWENIEFESDFTDTPIVLSQVQSYKGSDFVRTRMKNITENSFAVSMEEEEKLLASDHSAEEIGYIAMSEGSGDIGNLTYEAGTTGDVVTHNNYSFRFDSDFNDIPLFMAGVASYDGADSVGVRQSSVNADGVTLKLEEDKSKDAEIAHTKETVNFLAISGDGVLRGANTDDLANPQTIDLKKYWYYYNYKDGEWSETDSYQGSVIAPVGTYSINQTYDFASDNNEIDSNGTYFITAVEDYDDSLTSDAGKVLVNTYIDRDNGEVKEFIPYLYRNGVQPAGTNYLGSELDYIEENDSVIGKFGKDYYEADYEPITQNDWKAEYFNNINLSGDSVFTENLGDGTQNFSMNWGSGSPDNVVNNDNFSAIITTRRKLESGWYQVQTGSDDGIRVTIDNRVVIDSWTDRGFTEDADSAHFYFDRKEKETDIKIEYYEKSGGAAIDFKLQTAGNFPAGTYHPSDLIEHRVDLEHTSWDWNVEQVGDFNGDGIDDVLIRRFDGTVHAWLLDNNAQINGRVDLEHTSWDWNVEQVGDFNGDEIDDVLIRRYDGRVHAWLLDNNAQINGRVDLEHTSWDWNVEQVGDFNGDGIDDVLIRRYDGTVHAWLLDNNAEINGRVDLEHTSWDWNVEQVGDFNGDEIDDVLIRRYDGRVHAWLLDNNAQINGRVDLEHTSWDWNIEQVGDFNEDGITDILNRRYDGQIHAWLLDSNAEINSRLDLEHTSFDWNIEQVGDFNGDGTSDIMIRRYDGNVHGWILKEGRINVYEPTDETQNWLANVYSWDSNKGNQAPQDFFMNERQKRGTISLGSHTRRDDKFGLEVNWEDGSINGDSRLPQDNFAIRAYTHKHLEAGKTYKLWVRGDDGFQFFAKQWHEDYNVDLLTNRRELPTEWKQNYGAAKDYEFTVDHTGMYDFHFHLYEGGGLANFDFKLEEINNTFSGDSSGSLGGNALLTQQNADYFKARPEYYIGGNIFSNNRYGSHLVDGRSYREGNCTWYAYGRVKELGGNVAALNSMYGNANQWHNQISNGSVIVSEPQVGDIAQWTRNGWNHVAVVEKVYISNGVKRVILSESQWVDVDGVGGLGTLHRIVDYTASNPDRYIRVPGVNTNVDSGGYNSSSGNSGNTGNNSGSGNNGETTVTLPPQTPNPSADFNKRYSTDFRLERQNLFGGGNALISVGGTIFSGDFNPEPLDIPLVGNLGIKSGYKFNAFIDSGSFNLSLPTTFDFSSSDPIIPGSTINIDVASNTNSADITTQYGVEVSAGFYGEIKFDFDSWLISDFALQHNVEFDLLDLATNTLGWPVDLDLGFAARDNTLENNQLKAEDSAFNGFKVPISDYAGLNASIGLNITQETTLNLEGFEIDFDNDGIKDLTINPNGRDSYNLLLSNNFKQGDFYSFTPTIQPIANLHTKYTASLDISLGLDLKTSSLLRNHGFFLTDRMEQIIDNLIGNSSSYTESIGNVDITNFLPYPYSVGEFNAYRYKNYVLPGFNIKAA